jgi:hypothetical protein
MIKKGMTKYHVHTKLKRVQREQIKQLHNNVHFQMQKWSKVVNPDRDTHTFVSFYVTKIFKDERFKIPNRAPRKLLNQILKAFLPADYTNLQNYNARNCIS